jgi:hypothetical protein
MKTQSIYPARFIKGEHLDEPAYERTIVEVTMEEVQAKNGDTESKPVALFSEAVGSGEAKRLILNRTNLKSIEVALDCDETDLWAGQQITIVRETWQGQPVVRIQH